MFNFEKEFWVKCCRLYNAMKEIYIYAEEYSKEFSCIMQPIKEQRDALDHIIRSYCKLIESNPEEKQAYIEKNFNKAMGHLYRAYYDSADIFTIVLRSKIADCLSIFTYKEIISVWDKEDYNKTREYLITVNQEIAQLRIKKDIIEDKKKEEEIFDKYKSIIQKLTDIYKDVLLTKYPLLAEKYN